MAKYFTKDGNLIVTNNKPEGGYTIEEWSAAHLPQEAESNPEVEKQARITAIKFELNELDMASIRPLRAIDNGGGTEEDHVKLIELEALVAALRAELYELTVGDHA